MTNQTNSFSIGFIKLHRKLNNWEWINDPNVFCTFIHILLNANYEDKKWKGNDIKRGQFLTSLDRLSEITGLSKQQTRTALEKLKSTNEITCIATNKFTIIEVVNYNTYQSKEFENNTDINPQDNIQSTFNQHSNNIQITLTKEIKEIKETKELKEIEIEKDFEIFWNFYTPVCAKDGTYTNKGSKQKAFKSYIKARNKFDHNKIMDCLKLYLEDCQKRAGYTKHVVSWLNSAIEDNFEYEQVIPIQSQVKPIFQTQEQRDQEIYTNFLKKHGGING